MTGKGEIVNKQAQEMIAARKLKKQQLSTMTKKKHEIISKINKN